MCGKYYLKIYCLLIIGFIFIRTFYNSAIISIRNKSFVKGFRNSLEGSLLIPVVIYLFNI